MASIFDMLTRQQPQFQTRQALLVLGLQHDFIFPEGVLPVTNGDRFLRRIKNLVPTFRANGDVYWVRTERGSSSKPRGRQDHGTVVVTNEPTPTHSRPSDDLSDRVDSTLGTDESTAKDTKAGTEPQPSLVSRPKHQTDPELFLKSSSDGPRCCDPTSHGSSYIHDVEALQSPKDTHIVKSHYSAFRGTQLLFTLRARLVTEIYLAGCMTNLCVYATALDAAQHGIQINIVEDCLGYRTPHRHAEAINRMIDDMGAYMTTSKTVMTRFEEGDDLDRMDSRGASPELVEVCQNGEVPETGPFSYPTSINHPNSSTMATRPTSAEEHLPPVGLPQAGIVVPEYVASLCALGDVPGALEPDEGISLEAEDEPKQEFPVYQNMDAIRSIERIDTRTRTEEWRKSCSPVEAASDTRETQEEELAAALTRPSSSRPVSKEATPESAEGRTSKKRRSADLDDVDIDFTAQHLRETSTAPTSTHDSDQQPLQKKNKCIPSLANFPTKVPGHFIGKGDTTISYDLLSPTEADKAFNTLITEVPWQRMSHVTGDVPRLVCCQGTFLSDGSMPVYRHPSDSTLPLFHWSPTVDRIRRLAEAHVGHKLNHALIQLYRSGQDHISEHSDKTLDIVPGSQIVNVSLGAQRTMRLRSKRMKFPPTYSSLSPEPPQTNIEATETADTPTNSSASQTLTPLETARSASMPPSLRTIFARTVPKDGTLPARTTERIPLPHASILSFGLATNAHFLHGIQPDRRLGHDLSLAEKAYGGMRISLTFREIGTFLSGDEGWIWGVGARGKEKGEAGRVVNGDEEEEGKSEAEELLRRFGRENQGGEMEGEGVYEGGSDVLHLKQRPGKGPMVFLSGEEGRDGAVLAAMKFLGLQAQVTLAPELGLKDYQRPAAAHSAAPAIVSTASSPADEGNAPAPTPSTFSRPQASQAATATATASVDVNRKPFLNALADPIPPPTPTHPLLLRDADDHHTEVRGWIPILSYLSRYYSPSCPSSSPPSASRAQTAIETELFSLLPLFELYIQKHMPETRNVLEDLQGRLALLAAKSSTGPGEGTTPAEAGDGLDGERVERETVGGLAGREIGVVDVAFLHLVRLALVGEGEEECEGLRGWMGRVEQVIGNLG